MTNETQTRSEGDETITTQNTIASWTTFGGWHNGPAAPNGSAPVERERVVTEYMLYTADYYGKGFKFYLRSKPSLHYKVNGQTCISRLPGSDDGNMERIANVLADSSVTISC